MVGQKMKRLRDEIQLKGKIETIDATDLRAHVGEVLTQVMLGKSYTVTRKGRTVCHIVPPGQADLSVEIGPDGKMPDWLKAGFSDD